MTTKKKDVKPLTNKELGAAAKKIADVTKVIVAARVRGDEIRRSLRENSKPVKITTAGAIEQPPKVRGIPGKKMEPHHIEAVGKALRRGVDKAITIRGLAKRLRCSMGAAERRFNAYMKKHAGFDKKLKSVPVRDGERGPFSTGFYL